MVETIPLVTIGLSTYNRAKSYLKNALDSAVSQTWNNLEIIVSDNCSSDNTSELVASYADPRIKYIRHKKNIGAENNFNYCVSQAKGEYFLLLHDDDEIDPDFIEKCMKAIGDKKETGIIRTGTRVINGKGDIKSIKPNYMKGQSNTNFLLSWFNDKTTLYLCSTLFNTKALKEIGGFKSRTSLFNDVAAMLKLADRYGRVDISQVMASFRRHGSNLGSANKADDWLEDSVYILEIINQMDLVEKDLIIKEAQCFLSRKCYRYVRAIPSVKQQVATYMKIYHALGYRYSPVAYNYSTIIKPRLSFGYAKKLVRNSFGTVKT